MQGQRHIFAVSDATGETCETLVQAALSQFTTASVVLKRVPDVRTVDQARDVVRQAAGLDGVVIFTMVSPSLREAIQEEGRRNAVPTLDVLGPILTRLSDVLGIVNINDAEIILVGVSRTSKTPTSIYLSYRGWRTANVPLVLGIDPPDELFRVDQRKVVGLTLSADVLRSIRLNRQTAMNGPELGEYLELSKIREELVFARRLFDRQCWPVIDTTHKSIEETATEVMRIVFRQTGVKKGRPL